MAFFHTYFPEICPITVFSIIWEGGQMVPLSGEEVLGPSWVKQFHRNFWSKMDDLWWLLMISKEGFQAWGFSTPKTAIKTYHVPNHTISILHVHPIEDTIPNKNWGISWCMYWIIEINQASLPRFKARGGQVATEVGFDGMLKAILMETRDVSKFTKKKQM